MKTRFLFPHRFKIIGLVLLILGLAFAYMDAHGFHTGFFTWKHLRGSASAGLSGFFGAGPDEDFSNEIQLISVLLGLLLIAFSKEKVEDEQINQARLESLQWAVYVNYGVFAVLIFAFYSFDFLSVMMYNVFTLLVFFIIRFRWVIFKNSRLLKEDIAA